MVSFVLKAPKDGQHQQVLKKDGHSADDLVEVRCIAAAVRWNNQIT